MPDYPANSARPLLLPKSDLVFSLDASNCPVVPSTNFVIDETRLHVVCYQFGTIVEFGRPGGRYRRQRSVRGNGQDSTVQQHYLNHWSIPHRGPLEDYDRRILSKLAV